MWWFNVFYYTRILQYCTVFVCNTALYIHEWVYFIKPNVQYTYYIYRQLGSFNDEILILPTDYNFMSISIPAMIYLFYNKKCLFNFSEYCSIKGQSIFSFINWDLSNYKALIYSTICFIFMQYKTLTILNNYFISE